MVLIVTAGVFGMAGLVDFMFGHPWSLVASWRKL